MKIRADFNERVIVHSDSLDWVKSPMAGVDRRALDRVGDEVARATTIVRYAPGSKFSPHVHTGGEEFIVLDGVFQDEHGDFSAGSYIRNPPQSSHTPGSDQGCIIFVKLWQFQPDDRQHICINMNDKPTSIFDNHAGIRQIELFKDGYEDVKLLDWDADYEATIEAVGGIELFVLSGDIKEQDDVLVKNSWLRLPMGMNLQAKAGKTGAKIWMKTGNLKDVQNQIDRVESVAK